MLPIELMWTELIEVLVTPNSIVETLNASENFLLGLSTCAENPPFDAFTF
jgi:hypothetical protein